MERREFVTRAGLLLGSVPLVGAGAVVASRPPLRAGEPCDWGCVRDEFALTRSRIHMAGFLLASHPRPVAEAIERHRRGLDEDPATYWHERFQTLEAEQRAAAGEYLAASPGDIALTDSTTMGLALIYGTLRLAADDEILTTTHDHYSTEATLQLRAARTGAKLRQVTLYDDPARASADEMVARLRAGVTERTRVVAVTWVHSGTGVKLPIGQMARALRQVNAARDDADRILFCVDGVHGFGVEDVTVQDLGCDFLAAGAHKWLFGPRGTGIVWGRPEAWARAAPVIPSFGASYAVWLGLIPPERVVVGDHFTPGGFHSFEHRWALAEAFRFHQTIGKARIAERIHALNSQAKEALAGMRHVRLHTPRSPELSAGIICFDVAGLSPDAVVARLFEQGIVASSSPYRVSHARLAPSLLNDESEVERAVAAVAALG